MKLASLIPEQYRALPDQSCKHLWQIRNSEGEEFHIYCSRCDYLVNDAVMEEVFQNPTVIDILNNIVRQ